RPAVIAGGGVWWDKAWKQLASFAQNGRLPVYLNGSGRGALPPDHELFFQHSRGTALQSADVVCVIGTPLDFRLGFGRFRDDTKLVHIHADDTELGRNRAPDAGIVGDCAAVLGILAAASRVLRVHAPGQWLDPGPFGCLGVGPPYALGVKTAKPAKQVVVVAGDGAFGLNGFEFETLTRFGLPVTFVIGNDAAWGEIRIPQIGLYGDGSEVATRLASTRYDRLTE